MEILNKLRKQKFFIFLLLFSFLFPTISTAQCYFNETFDDYDTFLDMSVPIGTWSPSGSPEDNFYIINFGGDKELRINDSSNYVYKSIFPAYYVYNCSNETLTFQFDVTVNTMVTDTGFSTPFITIRNTNNADEFGLKVDGGDLAFDTLNDSKLFDLVIGSSTTERIRMEIKGTSNPNVCRTEYYRNNVFLLDETFSTLTLNTTWIAGMNNVIGDRNIDINNMFIYSGDTYNWCSISSTNQSLDSGSPCDDDDDCATGYCYLGVCSLKTSLMECSSNAECMSGECINGKCTKTPMWTLIDTTVRTEYGTDIMTLNFMSLMFIILIVGAIVWFGKLHLMSIFLASAIMLMLSVFFVMAGWLSGWILFMEFFVGIIALVLKIFVGGRD